MRKLHINEHSYRYHSVKILIFYSLHSSVSEKIYQIVTSVHGLSIMSLMQVWSVKLAST